MRDDFTINNKEILAKRVGYRCSNPVCRQLTTGPQEDPQKTINVGVAAHISAASPGGPRYNVSLNTEQRRSLNNGIWLCQKCAKLVDNDETRYTYDLLCQWKIQAEDIARSEIEGREEQKISIARTNKFLKIEECMPSLINEMKQDLKDHPLYREFVLLKRSWGYWHKDNKLVYYYDHPELDNKVRIIENLGFINDITYNNTKRYVMSEEFVDYLVR